MYNVHFTLHIEHGYRVLQKSLNLNSNFEYLVKDKW